MYDNLIVVGQLGVNGDVGLVCVVAEERECRISRRERTFPNPSSSEEGCETYELVR
jgi:hypothetical protein